MRASVGHRAPTGERNEAGRPHLQQMSVSVLVRPTGCITYEHRQKGTRNLNRPEISLPGASRDDHQLAHEILPGEPFVGVTDPG